MGELTARGYFAFCRMLGRLLRSGRYATARVVDHGGVPAVRKRRAFYAPLLVGMGGPLVRVLDIGVRVLPQREWEERERALYLALRGTVVRVDADGTLVLPRLTGATLAALLDDPAVAEATRSTGTELAVVALAELHRRGITHGDAMAENVMVDVAARAAHWFDFETVHDPRRPMAWRRADDVRALLATCLLRTAPARLAQTLGLILDAYGDDGVIPLVAASFASARRRPLAFHLGQAGLSYRRFRDIGRLLSMRAGR